MRGLPETSLARLVVQRCLKDSLLAIYLHGSAVTGGLRPNSDVDLLAVIEQPISHAVRIHLVNQLMAVSGRYPAPADGPRPLELVIFQRAELARLAYPPRSEFVYGEWLRGAFEAGDVPHPVSDPQFTLLLAQARNEAKALIGPDLTALLPIIPQVEVCRAIGDAYPMLLDGLQGDERNVLLTLARMWRTLAQGDFVPKDVAAAWAIPRLPVEFALLLARAREEYLVGTHHDWQAQRQAVRQLAQELGARVAAFLPLQNR
jgi:streptomycin 3"-adenylyltransferase